MSSMYKQLNRGTMLLANLENIENGREITEQELDALYLYLDMYVDTMSDEQKMFWLEVMKKIDKEFYDDTSNGADDVRDVQSSEGGA